MSPVSKWPSAKHVDRVNVSCVRCQKQHMAVCNPVCTQNKIRSLLQKRLTLQVYVMQQSMKSRTVIFLN